MTKTDIAALELAIERARAHGPLHAQQIDGMLVDQLWEEVGDLKSVSASAARRSSRPGSPRRAKCPPTTIQSTIPTLAKCRREAVRLLREMLDLGISRWHPDPLAALEEAKEQKVAT